MCFHMLDCVLRPDRSCLFSSLEAFANFVRGLKIGLGPGKKYLLEKGKASRAFGGHVGLAQQTRNLKKPQTSDRFSTMGVC